MQTVFRVVREGGMNGQFLLYLLHYLLAYKDYYLLQQNNTKATQVASQQEFKTEQNLSIPPLPLFFLFH